MKFIIGFIFFGLLIYAISFYFPEAFQVLVQWASSIFDFIRNLFAQIFAKVTSA